MTKRRLEKNLALVAIITVIIAGVLGFIRETGGIEHDISSIIPEGAWAEPKGEGQFIISHNENEAPLAFVDIESAQGFWFSVPLTLSRINLFLLGYWPDWYDNLYWYILVLGFF